MIVREVTVSIHEKRNHPYEYGHYDASVSYTAEIAEDDDVGDVTARLIIRAESHVKAECDEWIAGVHEQNRIDQFEGSLEQRLQNIRSGWQPLKHAKQFLRRAAEGLPPDRYELWRERLRQALSRQGTERF